MSSVMSSFELSLSFILIACVLPICVCGLAALLTTFASMRSSQISRLEDEEKRRATPIRWRGNGPMRGKTPVHIDGLRHQK